MKGIIFKTLFILLSTIITSGFAIPPLAVDDFSTTNEDVAVDIDILANDTDPEGNLDPTSVTITVLPANGIVSVNPATGVVTYTPNENFNGTDTFEYEVCDLDLTCDQALVTVTIEPINDPPTVNNDTDETSENNPVIIDVLVNDDDPNDPLGNVDPGSLSILIPPQNGLVSIDPITSYITYIPETGFYGTDFLVYEVCDDGYPLPPTCDIATVTITVSHESPTIVDDYANTNEDIQVDIDILQNDTDPQNNFDLSSIAIIAEPLHGTVTVDYSTGILTYNPNSDYHGQDTLLYEICDMDNYCGQAYVIITIEAINDPPVVNDDTDFTLENIPVTTNILNNDDDPNDLLGNIDPGSISITSQPANGSLTIDYLAGEVTYIPTFGFYGTDSYEYQVCDDGYPLPPNCGQATVTITVDHQSPSANNDFGSGDEENDILVNILLNDTDPQGIIDPTTAEIIVPPLNGTAVLNEFVGIVTYTPNENFNGLDSLIYQVCDPDGYCDQGFVFFTVNPVNDPPIIADDNDVTTENAPVTTNVLANDSDINDPLGNIDPLSVIVSVNPINGSVIVEPTTGHITYTPDLDFTGFDQYTYQVCDDGNPLPALCGSAMVTINIIQETPTAVNDTTSTLEDTPVDIDILANDFDLQNNIDPGSVSIVVPPVNGIATYNVNSRLVTYTPSENYNGTDSFVYEVCDSVELCDQATVIITIEAVNDAPITIPDSDSTAENMAVTTMILENDDDPYDPLGDIDPESVTIISYPNHGEVSIDPTTGVATYLPNTGFYGTDAYTYNVCDNGYPLPALCNTATVALTISRQSPTAVNDALVTNEDTPAEVDVLANDTDPQNNIDPTTVEIYTEPQHGSATINAVTGAILYSPELHYYGPDSLVYTVCDTDGYCDQALVIIDMISVNDPPVANDDIVETGENVAVTTNVLLNDADMYDPLGDIDPTSVQILTEPLHGTVVVDSVFGYILYQPNQGYLGNDTYTYTVCDNGIPAPVLCGEALVHITIHTINHEPLAIADYGSVLQGGTISLNIIDNDSDPDGNLDPSTITVVEPPISGATVTTNETGWITINYQEVSTFFGLDTITYQVCDSLGLCDSDIIYMEVFENFPPVANTDYGTTFRSGNITVNVLENDTDPENNIDPSSLEVISDLKSGADVYIDENWQIQIDYFNVPEFINEDTLVYKICDQLDYCDSATLVISVGYESGDPVQVPDGFSPNGDGVNDYFVIPGIENFPGNELYVYNRWGSKVYSAKGYENSWDGKSNNNMAIGEPLAAGTYFYVLTLANGIDAITGYVYINH